MDRLTVPEEHARHRIECELAELVKTVTLPHLVEKKRF
jgi:hypothetical protein